MRSPCVYLIALLSSNPTTSPARAEDPLVHIQTDRPAYRLGETIWYRVHTRSEAPIRLRLLDARGELVEEATSQKKQKRPRAGSFFLSRNLRGGAYRLQALDGSALVHAVGIDVHDLELPALDLELSILAEVHYPGDEIVATFRARDLEGRPLKNALVHHLATFGNVRLRDSITSTDENGRTVLRLEIPEKVRESGHLAVGVRVGGKRAAVARPITVSASVARIDAYPEGGTIVEGHCQRLGLLLRDLDGAPAAAEGRILDDGDRTVATFRSDARGVASAVVPYASGRRYRAVVDRPSDVDRSFNLPGPTGHEVSIFVEPMERDFRVEVRGARKLEREKLDVYLTASTSSTLKLPIRILPRKPPRGSKDPEGLPVAQLSVSPPEHAGIGHIYVIRKGRAVVKRPVWLGEPSPVRVKLTPRRINRPLLVGEPVERDGRARRDGRPVSTDLAISIFQGDSTGMPDMALRSALEPALAPGVFLPADFLDAGPKASDGDAGEALATAESRVSSSRGYARRDAFLLVHGAFAYPATGTALTANGLPELEEGRLEPVTLTPRAGTRRAKLLRVETPGKAPDDSAVAGRRGRTVVEATGLERLLERAPFTRLARPAPGSDAVELIVPGKRMLATPGLGRPSDRPPQNRRVPSSSIDTRCGLFWSERVRTDSKGRTTIKLRLNDVVSDLAWIAQGRSSVTTASGRGRIRPTVGFRADIETPSHLHVGDRVDLMLKTTISDGSQRPVALRIDAPPCLRPLMRTRLGYDPRLDTNLHRFRFEVVAPSEDAELRIVAERGRYRQTQLRTLRVLHRDIEKTHGVAGKTRGVERFKLTVPGAAIPGSVRVFGSVSPGHVARMREAFRANLRQPHGCFDQYTTLNFANLLTLDALRELDTDPGLIEKAYHYARLGYDKILTYRDPRSGGFRLFPDQAPTVRCTIIGLRHLALYTKLYDGLGRPQLESSLEWLEKGRDISAVEALHLTASLNDIGRSWRGARRSCLTPHASLYEQALGAYCLATWPQSAVERETIGQTAERARLLEKHVDELMTVLSSGRATPADYGEGLMGGRGGGMAVAVRALLALTLHAVDRPAEGRDVLGRTAESLGRHGWRCGGAFALAAYARLVPPLGERMVTARFTATPGGTKVFSSLPGSTRVLAFHRSVETLPGESQDIDVVVDSGLEQDYDLGCRYRVEMPEPSPDAPLRIRTRISPMIVDVGQLAEVQVTVRPLRRSTASQVVARIGLPGGCEIVPSDLRQLRALFSVNGHVEAKDGFVDLYFQNAPRAPASYRFKVRARVAGSFRSRPSIVYPYYESGKEAYAPALTLKVVNTFGNPVDPQILNAAQLRRRR